MPLTLIAVSSREPTRANDRRPHACCNGFRLRSNTMRRCTFLLPASMNHDGDGSTTVLCTSLSRGSLCTRTRFRYRDSGCWRGSAKKRIPGVCSAFDRASGVAVPRPPHPGRSTWMMKRVTDWGWCIALTCRFSDQPIHIQKFAPPRRNTLKRGAGVEVRGLGRGFGLGGPGTVLHATGREEPHDHKEDDDDSPHFFPISFLSSARIT